MGRTKGSKNKTNDTSKAMTLDKKAQYFADSFIAGEHIDGAEKLAERILEKIRANRERLEQKYGKS